MDLAHVTSLDGPGDIAPACPLQGIGGRTHMAQDGTLGEMVYSITDRPAPVDADLAPAAGSALASAPSGQAPPGFGAGIRREVMAARPVHPDRQQRVPRSTS
ncbi:hypothetical protein ACWEQ7_25485 [Streptomyces sp. NPDC004069]